MRTKAMKKNEKSHIEHETIRKIAALVDVPIDMRKLQTYSAYLQGARKAMEVMAKHFPQIFKGKEAVYNKAEFELAISSLRAVDLFLSDEHEIHFRNHISNKQGKCVKCEAYFADRVSVTKEIPVF